MPNRPDDRCIFQFRSVSRAAQEKAAPAHIAPSNEINRELEPVAERCGQYVHVLLRADASQQNGFSPGPQFVSELSGIDFNRPSIPAILVVHVDAGKRPQFFDGKRSFSIDQPTVRGDDQNSGSSARWL